MTAKKQETAEQKLLKMIEASAGAAAQAPKTEVKVKKKQTFLSVLKTGNKVLFGLVLLTAWFCAREIFSGIKFMNQKVSFNVAETDRDGEVGTKEIPVARDLPYYLAGVKRRDFFRPYEEAGKSRVVASKKNRRIAEKTASLRLVGVSWLDSVETASVMIEDTEKKQTYFLQKGDKIGDIFVKTIYADSVKLGYKNEEILIQYDKSRM